MIPMNLFTKQKQTHRHGKQNYQRDQLYLDQQLTFFSLEKFELSKLETVNSSRTEIVFYSNLPNPGNPYGVASAQEIKGRQETLYSLTGKKLK